MKSLLITLSLLSASLLVKAQIKPILHPKLSKTLDSLYTVDQRPMKALMQHTLVDSVSKRLIAEQHVNFARHQPVLEAIVKRYGYPGFREVGEVSSKNFFTLVQHADKHPEFQAKVLALMLPEVKSKNVNSSDYAYLTDRLALAAGLPQEYGTQLEYKAIGQASSRNLRDAAHVNERRHSLGMLPLEDYLAKASEVHRQMNSPAAK